MLDCSYCNVITTCETIQVLREKGAAGFGHSKERCGKSRRNRHRLRGSLYFCLQFLAARWEGASPAGFRKVPRLTNPSSRRPVWSRVQRFLQTGTLEALMATPSRRMRAAQPSAKILSFDQARQRRAAQAQQPREPDPLDVLETALNIYIGALRGMVQDVRAKGRGA